ncbi:Alpha/Beta hydrolase protein [Crucibulum laeve]|uniref:Alpha/Beta hydrolase protein n=1 Tax=Crucibulum laeve TaxID=68775 RepID=A0A5C3LY39_9AGAR|nr:Alpha/Beta hydrolase protein [Crucibulum laeve]
MLQQSIVYPPDSGYPLYITAKKYALPEFESNVNDPDALTLVVLHSTSFHKETWEPSLSKLFSLSSQPGTPFKIHEAWAIDCPNHGESGELNDEVLKKPEFANDFSWTVSCEKYARAVHRFLCGGLDHGARVDFRKRNLVGIGHSLGANAILLLQRLKPTFNFKALVIVEPMLSPAGPEHLHDLRILLVKGAERRYDIWPSREVALKSFKTRPRTMKWDPRVLDLFVQHALRPHPDGVTLSCSRQQEIAMYEDREGPTKPVEDMNRSCAKMPVHLVLGSVNDYISPQIHAAFVDPTAGRRFASVTKIPGVGHLVPQETPDKLGAVIYEALVRSAEPDPTTRL